MGRKSPPWYHLRFLYTKLGFCPSSCPAWANGKMDCNTIVVGLAYGSRRSWEVGKRRVFRRNKIFGHHKNL